MRIILSVFFLTVCLNIFPDFSLGQSLTAYLQKGHSAVVKTLALSNDGNYLYTGSRDKSIKIWDVETGMEVRTLFGHQHTVNNLSVSGNGKLLASSSADLTVRLWDIVSGELKWTSPESREYMTAVSFSPDGKYLAAGGYDDKAVVYSVATGDTLFALDVNPDKGTGYGISLSWSNDGEWLATGEDNRTAGIYNVKKRSQAYRIKPAEGWCGGCPTLVAFHPGNKQLAKLSDKGNLELISLDTGKSTDTLGGIMEDIRALNYSADGSRLLVALKKELIIYDLVSKKESGRFLPESSLVINDAVFTKDAASVIIATNDNNARLIEVSGWQTKAYFQGLLQDQDKGGILYDPNNYWESYIARYIHNKNKQLLTSDDAYLLQGKLGTVVRMWEVSSGKPVVEFIGHEKAVISFDLSPDQTLLATGGGEGDVIIWQKKTGKLLKILKGHRSPVFDVRWSHDQTKLVSSSWDGQVLVWDVESGQKLSGIYWNNASAYAVTFTSNDLYLLVARLDKKLELYEVLTGELVKSYAGHTQNVNDLLLNDNEHEFISLSDDGYAIVWNIYDGLIRKRYKHPSGTVRAGLLHQGKLYTAGDDRIIYLWDQQSNTVRQKLSGHQAPVSSLNINQKGTMLISGDLDGVTKFWDLNTGKEILEHIIIDKANWVARNPEGYFYATDGAKKYVHYVKGNKAYMLDQFFHEFYTPELMRKTFSGNTGRKNKSLHGMLDSSPISEVKIAGVLSENELHATLYIKITDPKNVDEIQLFHNGKRLPAEIKDYKAERSGGDAVVYSYTTGVVSGRNHFMVKVLNKDKLESVPAETEIVSGNHLPGAVCYLLTIGINEYKNPKLNLNYARADASAFADRIRLQAKGMFSELKSYALFDSEATKENILGVLDTIIREAAINDMFIIYFAGHGSMSDELFYFIPYEATKLYDAELLKKSALSADEVQQKLTKLKALKQIVFIDACQSGGSVDVLAQRGALEEKAIAQLSRSAGIHVLSAAGSEQYASEYTELGHGLFTYVLLEALKGEADGAPKDGKVTVYEMKSFVDEIMPELNMRLKGKPQYPYTFSRGNDFPVGLIFKDR